LENHVTGLGKDTIEIKLEVMFLNLSERGKKMRITTTLEEGEINYSFHHFCSELLKNLGLFEDNPLHRGLKSKCAGFHISL